ncbi:hypothetical protein LTR97_011913 [Elasticomyces elasticus]|uniref:Uncharacterized protein n=1 Tax=Elasticomyces elasticus TaxID=574655 RepID=A0AAN7VM86_9PEZI|nr:hypothetical protein LTR97_011913 [Elasticomyces elasticus]
MFSRHWKDLGHIRDERKRDNRSLATVGDAIASFLQEPDDTTTGLDFASAREFGNTKPWSLLADAELRKARRTWLYQPSKWFETASLRRWVLTIGWCLGSLIIVIVMFSAGMKQLRQWNVPTDVESIWATGLGTPQPYATVNGAQLHGNPSTSLQLWIPMLYSNVWQLWLSGLYLLVNGLVSALMVAREWSQYTRDRKALRMSSPRGLQRGTFTLSLLFRYVIPLMVTSCVMHWLVSQSVFVVATRGFSYNGTNTTMPYVAKPELDAALAGFSFKEALLLLIVGSLGVVCVIGLGFFRSFGRDTDDINGTESPAGARKSNTEREVSRVYMPMVCSCSAAISAACHPAAGDIDAQWLPLIWGYLKANDQWCFSTSRNVSYPPLSDDTAIEQERSTSLG